VVTPAEKVLCGVCREPFDFPAEKARHLSTTHGAMVYRLTDLVGNDIYRWRLRTP
jgi:hypothetical protein